MASSLYFSFANQYSLGGGFQFPIVLVPTYKLSLCHTPIKPDLLDFPGIGDVFQPRNTSKDPLHVPNGPMTRSKTKALKEPLNALVLNVLFRVFVSSTIHTNLHCYSQNHNRSFVLLCFQYIY